MNTSDQNFDDWQTLKANAMQSKHDGDLPMAVEKMSQAIRVARAASNLDLEAVSMLNYIASLYCDLEDFDNAELALREAITISGKTENAQNGDNLLGLARILCMKGCYDEALKFAKCAKQTYRELDHPHGIESANNTIREVATKNM